MKKIILFSALFSLLLLSISLPQGSYTYDDRPELAPVVYEDDRPELNSKEMVAYDDRPELNSANLLSYDDRPELGISLFYDDRPEL